MFYVSSIKDNLFGVTDTDDNVEDFFTKEDLFRIVNKEKVEINGVDTRDNMICIAKPLNETVRLFKQGKVHLAISTMSINNDWFGLSFKSNPTSGEMKFVNHGVLNISRSGVNSFSFDTGSSKSFRSGLTLDDIMIVLERFSNWRLVDCKIGRF